MQDVPVKKSLIPFVNSLDPDQAALKSDSSPERFLFKKAKYKKNLQTTTREPLGPGLRTSLGPDIVAILFNGAELFVSFSKWHQGNICVELF